MGNAEGHPYQLRDAIRSKLLHDPRLQNGGLACHRLLDRRQQPLVIEGFFQEVNRLSPESLASRADIAVPGHDDHREAGARFKKPLLQCQAVHAGHANVYEQACLGRHRATRREYILAALPVKPPALHERACEQAAILVSLENLMTYPWIAQHVAAGTVHLHGWYFAIATGELLGYTPARNAFGPVAADSPDPPGSTY